MPFAKRLIIASHNQERTFPTIENKVSATLTEADVEAVLGAINTINPIKPKATKSRITEQD